MYESEFEELLIWFAPNEGATNESGFTALPGGFRDFNGTFYGIGDYGGWWSSSEGDTSLARGRRIVAFTTSTNKNHVRKRS